MTNRWSSTKSGDGQTKRQASKAARKVDWPEVTKEQVDAIDRLLEPEFAGGNWQTVESEKERPWNRAK